MTFQNSPRRSPARRAAGFTLVELLVVIAIIGILVGLLLPALNAAREAMRGATCSNQLKQIALAFASHETMHSHFPTGGWGGDWVGDPDRGYTRDQPGGWGYNTLSFMEQSMLHDSGADGDGQSISDGQRTAAMIVAVTERSGLNCPTRRRADLFVGDSIGYKNMDEVPDGAGVVRSDYAANAGSRPATEVAPSINNAASAADAPTPLYDGICFQFSEIGKTQIRDGSSNTYMVGEKFMDTEFYYPRKNMDSAFEGDATTMYAGDCASTLRVVGPMDAPVKPRHDFAVSRSDQKLTNRLKTDPNLVSEGFNAFGSAHVSGWHAVFCDGSTHKINFGIDMQTHFRLGSRNDGLPVQKNKL